MKNYPGVEVICEPNSTWCDSISGIQYKCNSMGTAAVAVGSCGGTIIAAIIGFVASQTEISLGTSVTVTGRLVNSATGFGIAGKTVHMYWAPPDYENYAFYKDVVTDSSGYFSCTYAGVDMSLVGWYALHAYFPDQTGFAGAVADESVYVISSCSGGVEISSCHGACTDPAISGFAYFCEPGTGHKYLCTQNKECDWCYVAAGECGAPCVPNQFLDPIVCEDGTTIYGSQCDADGFGTHQTNQVCPTVYLATAISIALASSSLIAGATQTVSGRLTAPNGSGIGGAVVSVWVKAPGAASFTKLKSMTTDGNGYYTASFVVNTIGTYTIYVGYAGTAPANGMAYYGSEDAVYAYAGEW